MLDNSKHETRNQSESVSATRLACHVEENSDGSGVLCSSPSSNSETELESDVESKLSSSWVYIPLIPPLLKDPPGEEWELILKGELHQ